MEGGGLVVQEIHICYLHLNNYDGQMSILLQLRQTGTMTEYKRSFDACMYHLLSTDTSLNSKWFVSHFVHGLRDELRAAVRLQHPASLTRAASLARIQEEEQEIGGEHQRPRMRPATTIRHHPAAAPNAAGAVVRAAETRRPADDFSRERQLRDFRKANGLVFRCGDKYSKEHKCKQPAQLLTIQVGDFGECLSDDVCHALELLQEPDEEQACCVLSVQALAGTEEVNTMRLRALVRNKVILILNDSGSTGSFVNSAFVQYAQLPVQDAKKIAVGLADGSRIYSTTAVSNLTWWC